MNESFTSPINKVKPYTVYDLSTRSVLSEEEINKCLIQASEKELLKKAGEYGLVYDIAKPNGDAPNCIALPAKSRSKSFSVLPNHYETKTAEQEKNYDAIPFRGRSNTAPANYDTTLGEVKRPVSRASRLVQPSSPGCAKRKIQQKLQRDGKQQIPTPRLNHSGTPSLLMKPSSGSRIPNSKIALPQSVTTDQQNQNTGIPKSKSLIPDPASATRKLPTADFRQSSSSKILPPSNRNQQGFQRSVPRVSQTNGDVNSSSKNSTITKCTPVSKSQSALYGMGKKSSPTAAHSDESISTKAVSGIPNKKGIPQRTVSALDNKRSLDSLRMSRENTSENLANRKSSTSSIPSAKSKQSIENLSMSRENTADSIRKRSQSALPKNSSGRTSGDGNDQNVEKPVKQLPTGTSKLKLPGTKSNVSPSSGSMNTNCKGYSGLKPPEESKLKKPTASMISPASVRKTGILKPATRNNNTVENMTKESVDKPKIKSKQLNETVLDKSPTSTTVKPNVTQMKETSLVAPSAFPKKMSEPYTLGKLNFDGVSEQVDHDEKFGLRYPTVGKIPQGVINRAVPSKIKMNETTSSAKHERAKDIQTSSNIVTNRSAWTFHHTQKDFMWVSSEDEDSMRSSQSSTPSPVYKLDIPSPDDEMQNTDSITYPYRSQNMTHQNVELILAERKQLTKMVDSESGGIKIFEDGYAEPEDCIKIRTNGYKVPLDYLDDENKLRFDENDKTTIHNSSNIINRIEDPFDKTSLSGFSNDPRSEQVSSPYKRIQPKIAIPPPQLSSLSTKGEFPLPAECIRTPSSDGEEFLLNCHTEMDVLRRKAREQAIKAWKKNISVQETSNEDFDESSKENIDSDVFYPNDAGENKDQAEKFALRSSVRHASDENIPQSMMPHDDTGDQLKTMTLGRDKKKKSKFKKFFQKLSSKKDGKEESATDYIDNETPSIEDYRSSSEPLTDQRSHSTVSIHTEKKNHLLTNDDDAWRRDTEVAIESLNKCHRLSSNSSDSALSSESLSFSQRSNTFSIESAQQRNSSSLRRTPLRHSIDSYNKLIEVHRQTIEKIAYETSRLYCDCETLQGFDWDDFESAGENIQLGLTSYMVAPVTCNFPDGQSRRYTAWLKMENNSPKKEPTRYPNIEYSKTTLHRNCLHLCHSIEQAYATPLHDGIPKAIHINHVFISPQIPKMTLAKYASLTLDKHSRHPEIYEREIALIFLQVMKGVQHFYRNGVFLSGVQTDNLVILSNGEPSVVLSPRRVPNKCPVVAIAVLPNLGESFQKTEYSPITSVCHQLAFVLYELLHSSYHDELKDAVDITMLLATLPDLTIKSIYSRHLQCIINMLLNSTRHTNKSFDDIRLMLEVLLFGPSDLSDHKDDAINLISKWYNRRCVDMVTHILKEASLVVLRASGCGHDVEKMKAVDQELLLECEFLADSTPADIYRISKMLNR